MTWPDCSKLRALIAVPKIEINRREKEWQKHGKKRKKAAKQDQGWKFNSGLVRWKLLGLVRYLSSTD